jgi:hypothetical protein
MICVWVVTLTVTGSVGNSPETEGYNLHIPVKIAVTGLHFQLQVNHYPWSCSGNLHF